MSKLCCGHQVKWFVTSCNIKLFPFGSEMTPLIKIKRSLKGKMSNGCIFSEAGSTFCGDQQFSLVLAIGTSRSKKSADCRVCRFRGRLTKYGRRFMVSHLVQMLSTKGPPAIEGKPVPWDWQRCKGEITESAYSTQTIQITAAAVWPVMFACLHMRAAPSSTPAASGSCPNISDRSLKTFTYTSK